MMHPFIFNHGLWNLPGTDPCKSKSKNVVFGARINEVWRDSKMWLGLDGIYLSHSDTDSDD